MGANYRGQKKAISELNALSRDAKEFLNHHIANALNVVIVGIETEQLDMAKEAAWHIIDDLHMAGIRTIRR
ncbi:MAG: hypothetical protein HZA15_15605 [Nitrospirae bacterium]|nr:hypothetical protein [Nitrospirota bacterium]